MALSEEKKELLKTNRRCFGMEIDPQYCQMSVQRWVDFTGKDGVSINGQLVSWREYAANA